MKFNMSYHKKLRKLMVKKTGHSKKMKTIQINIQVEVIL